MAYCWLDIDKKRENRDIKNKERETGMNQPYVEVSCHLIVVVFW
jgi:hypothetical protein